jgi:hypothetical protein
LNSALEKYFATFFKLGEILFTFLVTLFADSPVEKKKGMVRFQTWIRHHRLKEIVDIDFVRIFKNFNILQSICYKTIFLCH